MTIAKIELPPKLVPVFAGKPLGSYRYRGAHGGRGSAKSRSFATMAAVFGFMQPMRVLCTREFQNSIRESFHAELRTAIQTHKWLSDFYEIGVDYIRAPSNGTEFMFRGLRNNIGSLRSIADIDLTIVEEAEDAPEDSWLALEATVLRKEHSEIWPLWNPKFENSPTDKRFRKDPPNKSVIVEMNWRDNPFFPEPLEELRQRQQRNLDPGTYAWIWEGQYLTKSDALVLNGKCSVEAFTPAAHWSGPYFGADWGFSQDPTVLIKCWVYGDRLYIEYELYKIGLEITDTPASFRSIPGAESHIIMADSARPETISHCKRGGLNVVPAVKGTGSVEDGIAFLRGFERIIIHPRCTNIYAEASKYSYKTDRLSGNIMPDIIDAHNHGWDAVRYALEPIMKRNYVGFGVL